MHFLRQSILTLAACVSLFALANCGGEGPSGELDQRSSDGAGTHPQPLRLETIELDRLEDKIRGGWAGQMIGVSYGAPTEFRYLGRVIPEEELPEWTPDRVKNSINQDDLYVDMTFVAVLDEKGWDATTEDFGAAFRDSQYPLWHANYAARRALRRGTSALESGSPAVNPHANDIDFQIEADFIGLLTPGMPQAAVELAQRVGRVMNGGDGILGGVFVSGLYSAAFFESDPRTIVEHGLALLPEESSYGKVIADTLQWSEENSSDWLATWQLLEDEYGTGEVCPQGAGAPFNIDAQLNGAYIALGLLYGEGDFERTMRISTRAGQDSDCNPASAVGVLGVVLGYDRIPELYKSGIAEIARENFAFTNYSFDSIISTNLEKVLAIAERNGGHRIGQGTDGALEVPIQAPVRAVVEPFNNYGRAQERIKANDRRVTLTGEWEVATVERRTSERVFAHAEEAGAEAEVSFEGTGAILTAVHQADGGTLEVWLDGESQGIYDTYSEEDPVNPWNSKYDEAVWHRFGLADGSHTLRVRVLGQPYTRDGVVSEGTRFSMQDVVVFR